MAGMALRDLHRLLLDRALECAPDRLEYEYAVRLCMERSVRCNRTWLVKMEPSASVGEPAGAEHSLPRDFIARHPDIALFSTEIP